MKLKKGDLVSVLTGKYKGKTGKILKVLVAKERCVVEGVALAKVHKKATKQGEKSEIVSKELSIHISNLAYYDSESKKAIKIGYKFDESQKKMRYSKLTQEVIK